MAQPLLALVRQSDDGPIDVLAPPHIAPVFEAMAEVNQLIIAPNVHGKLQLKARFALGRKLSRAGYDRCYVLPNSLKSALVPWFARIGQRIGSHNEDVPRLHKNQILIDGAPTKGQGLLLQIFTANQIGPIFFELIQRKGNEGFGEGNFRALFESIEADQIRRGVLKAEA